MAKEFGHTQTLFIQGGKYKWSFHYDHYQKCGLVKFKHKGRGLCTSCWDKERDKDPRRKEIKANAGHKWHKIHKPRKPREEWRKKGPKPTGFDKEQYRREWYQKNRDVLLLLRKGERKHKHTPCPLYLGRPIPFDIGPRDNNESYEDYKERLRKFDLIKAYLKRVSR